MSTEATQGTPQRIELTEAQVQMAHKQLRSECNALAQKIAEFEQERNEHSLVLEAMEPMDSNRKCFRMVGGVLVERTVGEVRPAVAENRAKMEGVIKTMQEQLKKKEQELIYFLSQFGNRSMKDETADEVKQAGKQSAPKSTGVLV
eukprot:GILK01002019.1.p1 GENE.GILK01002019.1~~GILK01002019.1.p1  ORF type:complete len:161 (-),score=40.09 GILK01002019.1:49-486(-)